MKKTLNVIIRYLIFSFSVNGQFRKLDMKIYNSYEKLLCFLFLLSLLKQKKDLNIMKKSFLFKK